MAYGTPERHSSTGSALSGPGTREAIRNWLEDTNASALATANQFVDREVVDDIYDDWAQRVFEDVSRDYLPFDIAVQRQQYRELGFTAFSYATYADGRIEVTAS